MSRAYSTSAVAHILGVSPKWLDNLLSANPIKTSEPRRQGRARHLTLANVSQLFIAKTLIDQTHCTASRAMAIAETLLDEGEIEPCPGLRFTLNAETLELALTQLLVDAVQAAPPRTRGRPPSRMDPEPDFLV
jgi:hypothetical protein